MTWLPEQGMRMLQATADLPGLGETDLLVDEPFGGALLIPFANRIRGGRLPANWKGRKPGAEPCAMHGLVLQSRFEVLEQSTYRVLATLDAGNFGGNWPSRAFIRVEAVMWCSAIDIIVDVANAGDETMPVGVGWHPYFRIPSGRREQARVHLAACERAVVDNYDDVFPTGELKPVRGTPYDLRPPEGAALGSQYFDDCFVDLLKNEAGEANVELLDPASGYHMRLTSLSPEVRAMQMYAPPSKPFVVLEPQFNLADPFSSVWPATVDTGMVPLAPLESVRWRVRWELLH